MDLASWSQSQRAQRSLAHFLRVPFSPTSNVDYSLGDNLHRVRLAGVVKRLARFIEGLANECGHFCVERAIGALEDLGT